MTQKHIRHVVMRKYRKHADAITMSKAIGKSLSQISTVHQFRIHLNVGSHDNCNIVLLFPTVIKQNYTCHSCKRYYTKSS